MKDLINQINRLKFMKKYFESQMSKYSNDFYSYDNLLEQYNYVCVELENMENLLHPVKTEEELYLEQLENRYNDVISQLTYIEMTKYNPSMNFMDYTERYDRSEILNQESLDLLNKINEVKSKKKVR